MYFFGTLRIFTSAAVGLEHFNIEDGGKVVLPPSILLEVSDDMSSESPLMFSLSHPITEVQTHCGVIEFSAEEGSVIAPSWVLDQIGLVSGDNVYIESIHLPVGSYSRFKPMSTSFLDISDQKAVLENLLRGFSCLTTGDIIPIHYNNNTYNLKIVETRPGDAICIVNCDLEVEFEEPVGYVVPTSQFTSEGGKEQKNVSPGSFSSLGESVSFTGTGYRLDGKNPKKQQPSMNALKPLGEPDYDWKFGTLDFFRDVQPSKSVQDSSEFSPFSGSGRSLK